MKSPTAPTPFPTELRPLRPEDLAAVIKLDKQSSGLSRDGYFEKRLQAALQKPKQHIQFALTGPSGLVGFLLARLAGGEFGRPEDVVVLETIGVDPEIRQSGLGQRMLGGLQQWMGTHEVHGLATQVDWRNHLMLKFLAGAGFSLAPRMILERDLSRLAYPGELEEGEETPQLVRRLKREDLDAIHRIDQRITGQDRRRYLERKLDEALNESAVQVSLVAEADGFVVAFAIAKVDFGGFGHVEPAASMDTIGVDPRFARRGYGRALMAQMVENLAGLRVERLESEVAAESFSLLRFLYDLGFGPSQRLCFQRRV
ncbi:MAG: GNAT family N-acetyltransferase [Myxococcota bacterium]